MHVTENFLRPKSGDSEDVVALDEIERFLDEYVKLFDQGLLEKKNESESLDGEEFVSGTYFWPKASSLRLYERSVLKCPTFLKSSSVFVMKQFTHNSHFSLSNERNGESERERERTRFVVMLSENSSAQKIYYE